MSHTRESWGGNFGFLMAAISSAVGLGNIWAFPYKMGTNGGFAFLIVYVILAVILGYVVVLGELTLGRMSQRGCVGTYQRLSKPFGWIGWMGVASAFLITGFYSVLGAYCIKYLVVNFGDILGASFGSNGRNAGDIFGSVLTSQGESIVYAVIFMAMTCVVIASGIKDGIERFSKIAMPLLFVLLLITVLRAVTLPGAEKGLAFMFEPNFEPFKTDFIGVLSAASRQLFYSLSIGMAIMITYGSYMTKNQNLERSTCVIIFSDTFIAILAGMAVIPAAFALGGEGAALAGPKLLYITLQNVFISMGYLGGWVGFFFFALVILAAVTSSVSLMETSVTFFLDRAADKGQKANRKLISILVCVAITSVAIIVAADGLGSNGVWVPFQSTFGVQPWNDCWLDLLDAASEGFMMPFGACLMCLCIGYEVREKFAKEVTLNGNPFKGKKFYFFSCRYICPIILLFVLYDQLKMFGFL